MAPRGTPAERAADAAETSQKAQARRSRTRRRGRGSIQSYQTAAGKRWRYQIWVPVDPEQPDLGEKKFSRGGFSTAADADAALQDALKRRDQQEKFGGKVPTLGVYADAWVEGLKLCLLYTSTGCMRSAWSCCTRTPKRYAPRSQPTGSTRPRSPRRRTTRPVN